MRWKRVLFLLIVLAALGAAGWFVAVRMEREAPAISFAEEPAFIGRGSQWTFTVSDRKSGLRQVRVWVRQGTEMAVAYAVDIPSPGWWSAEGERVREVTVRTDPGELNLADGPATLIVAAQDNSLWGLKGNSTFLELPVTVDTKPPRIDLLSTVHNVAEGGTGLVIFRVGEEPARAGVEADGVFYPAYPEAAGGEGAHLAYFALPPETDQGLKLVLVAADRAGNETRRAFPVRILRKSFPRDTMNISDAFLARKVPEFQDSDPGLSADLLEAYLIVNREWRERDHRKLRELCAESAPERLWAGAFLQMPNTKNMAPYAVRRTYMYRGKVVDRQVHLGLDLASTAGAPVPAANSGVVAMTGGLGIYGQTVLVDHGQGLFSLYSHLSGIAVAEGERVERGQTVGTSGQTGMAGGDHLHFSILASGEFVNPVEWLDSHWIEDNIDSKLRILAPAL